MKELFKILFWEYVKVFLKVITVFIKKKMHVYTTHIYILNLYI